MIPYLPEQELKTFYKYLDACNVYFEYGSGGSTYQAFQRKNIKKIYSVENDKNWINVLYQSGIPKNSCRIQIMYISMKIIPNKYGKPAKNTKYEDWIKYSRAFSTLDDISKKEVDLIMIDGRFRVACLLNLFNQINENVIIIFDDFYTRPHYHIVLKYFDVIERAGRLAVLKKKLTNPPSENIVLQYEKDWR